MVRSPRGNALRCSAYCASAIVGERKTFFSPLSYFIHSFHTFPFCMTTAHTNSILAATQNRACMLSIARTMRCAGRVHSCTLLKEFLSMKQLLIASPQRKKMERRSKDMCILLAIKQGGMGSKGIVLPSIAGPPNHLLLAPAGWLRRNASLKDHNTLPWDLNRIERKI